MAKSKKEKILTLQEQIDELLKKKKEMEDKLYKDTGHLLTKEWECEDDKVLIKVIKELSAQARELISKYSDDANNEDSLDNEDSNNEGQVYQTITQ